MVDKLSKPLSLPRELGSVSSLPGGPWPQLLLPTACLEGDSRSPPRDIESSVGFSPLLVVGISPTGVGQVSVGVSRTETWDFPALDFRFFSQTLRPALPGQ